MRIFWVLAMVLAFPWQRDVQAQEIVDFNRDVKPILSDRCFVCHGPDENSREADLRLDKEKSAFSVLTAGNASESEIYRRITSTVDPMPPLESNLSLNENEKTILGKWIDQGAKWEKHWAFVEPEKAVLPKIRNRDWPSNEIDHFVLKRLENENLSPAARAGKEKILRRITFDVTGLPPTLTELDDFLSDESANAYEKVLDRLLSTDRFGERMASDWLDVARYSDTYGYQVDRSRFVWPWRDWVIRAFNNNLPYDQFITEQLAGDLLKNATEDQILATTFNRLHPQKVEGGSVNEEFRVEYVADRLQTAGTAFLGLTIECARCHDHKYDPISQKEYYELFAFFNNIDESGLYSFFDSEAIPSPTLLLPSEDQKQRFHELTEAEQSAEQLVERSYESIKFRFADWIGDVEASNKSRWEIEPEEESPNWRELKGRNEFVIDPDSLPGYMLTGDDQVNLPMGDFRRHQPFTIASRIKIPDGKKLLSRAVIFHRSKAWTDSASRGYQLLILNGRLNASLIHFWPGNAISVETNEAVPVNQWLHVTIAYDGSSRASGLVIYLDGKKVSQRVVKDSLQKKIVGNGTSHLGLGARFRDVGFKDGHISDVRVFGRRLSELEIADVFQPGAIGKRIAEFLNSEKATTEPDLLELFANQDSTHQKMVEELAAARKAKNDLVDNMPEIMVMQEMDSARSTFVLERGAYDQLGEAVLAATPDVLPSISGEQSMDRLAFAKWLTSDNHPLTARVAVNHFWQILFGDGLVRTPEDFGSQGQPPSHPDLLDWLAVDFREHGWDVKRLLKKIVMSSTYRQSTAASDELLQRDPYNKWLSRASTYRLPAEMIRDSVLFTSGLLVEQVGGAPVRPYELEHSFKPAKPDQGEGLYRRSLYTFWQRNGPAPMMLTLDAAKRDVCQVKRERTSSPLAALVQLNSPQIVEASRKLAEQLLQENDKSTDSIAENLFRIMTSRYPTTQEKNVLVELFENQLKHFDNDRQSAAKFLSIGFSKSAHEDVPALAAWAVVANMMFSFDEFVMKR